MLGSHLYKIFKTDNDLTCTDKDVNESWLSYLDFTDYDKYHSMVAEHLPDYLFHIGALTDLEYCTLHPDEAYNTNVLGVENAVRLANLYDIPIIYISTAGIFDGRKNWYDDWDNPAPINIYGRTKYLGEKYVVENANKYYVFRAGWMMGGGDKDKKFVKKIADQVKDKKKIIRAVTDKWGSPTYAHDFAINMRDVLRADLPYGVYNMSGEGFTSRWQVANKIIKILGHKNDIKVLPVKSEFFSEYFVHRPSHEVLINSKLRLRNMDNMTPWDEALEHYLLTCLYPT